MAKTIAIDGYWFEVHRSKNVKVEDLHRYAYRTLRDCYDKPSTAKQVVYDGWCKWAWDNYVEYFGVCSYNTFDFCLQGLIEYDGVKYILKITPNHNWAYIVEE